MLKKAQTAVQGNTTTFLNTRLADLQETAIRSFSMKRIAIKNATVMPLLDLGALNARREAMLKWLLDDTKLNNFKREGYIYCQVQTKENTPLPNEAFTLYFGKTIIRGNTNAQGVIDMQGLPLGGFIIRFDNSELVIAD